MHLIKYLHIATALIARFRLDRILFAFDGSVADAVGGAAQKAPDTDHVPHRTANGAGAETGIVRLWPADDRTGHWAAATIGAPNPAAGHRAPRHGPDRASHPDGSIDMDDPEPPSSPPADQEAVSAAKQAADTATENGKAECDKRGPELTTTRAGRAGCGHRIARGDRAQVYNLPAPDKQLIVVTKKPTP